MRFFARCLVERCRLDNILWRDMMVLLLRLLNNLPGPCGRVDCFLGYSLGGLKLASISQ